MRHQLDHFIREAERCVPHLSPEERSAWAEECHAQHPGFTEDDMVAGEAAKTVAIAAQASVAVAPPQSDAAAMIADAIRGIRIPEPVVPNQKPDYVVRYMLGFIAVLLMVLVLIVWHVR